MMFSSFVEAVVFIEADKRKAALLECLNELVRENILHREDTDGVLQGLMKREELGSSGVGRGVATPHTKTYCVNSLVGVVGVSADGIDWMSLDGEPVQLVFVLLSPLDRPWEHLRAIELISRELRDDVFCRFLRQARTVEDVWQLLREADNNSW